MTRYPGETRILVAVDCIIFGFDGKDRKSTRLNSSHSQISYAVFCLKKKKKKTNILLYACETIECKAVPTTFHTGSQIAVIEHELQTASLFDVWFHYTHFCIMSSHTH